MNGSELGKAFHDGRQTFSTAVVSPSPVWLPFVKDSGLDFAFIDNEHTPMDREKVAWMCQAFRAVNVAPIVRIPSPDPFLASMALDGGAVGVVAPYVETVEQIKALRGAVKYRPLKGRRLKEILDGEKPLDPGLEKFLAKYNEGNLLIINIESTPAMEILQELVSTPGLDAVLVGPHDLSISLNVPEDYSHPKMQKAVGEIIAACRMAKIGVGIHFGDIQTQIAWAKQGANILMHSCDVSLFADALKSDFQTFRQAMSASTSDARAAAESR